MHVHKELCRLGSNNCCLLLSAGSQSWALQWPQRLKSAYAMQEAIESFGRLPPMQYATGWVLSCIGRAYFEMVDYHQAAQAFEYARKADPSRLEVSS